MRTDPTLHMRKESAAESMRRLATIDKIEVPDLPQPHSGMKAMLAIAEGGLASEFHKRLVEYCREFDRTLDSEHEVGVRLVCYGQAVSLYVNGISYYNPSLIHFYGVLDDGVTPVQLIQHVSQISFLLMALPKKDPNKPKRPFGFAAHSTETTTETPG
jgi:hypothetical protein